jgi:methanogenic corrinoid protein MtbC1
MEKVSLPNTKETNPIKGRILMGIFSSSLQKERKNAVITSLLNAGLEAVTLGLNVNPFQYIQLMRKFSPHVLILFCQSNTACIEKLIQTIKEVGMRSRIRIIIYGSNINEITRDEVHADACANDEQELLDMVNEILSNPSH